MDNQDKEELRVLADACAEQIQKIAFDFKDIFNERSEDATDVAGGALSGTVLGGIAGGLIGAFGGPVGIAAGATAGAALGTPLGEFDAYDTDLTSGFKGGEVVTWSSVAVGSSVDKSAADSADGYVNPGTTSYITTGSASGPNQRVVLSKSAVATTSTSLMLVDDGLAGYGVLFGVVTGGTSGQTSFAPGAGTPLGPATYVGSGKLTVWSTPGMFGVTLDAVDTTSSTGLVQTNTNLTPGTPIYAIVTTGLLTQSTATHTTKSVGQFIDFETNRALVTTPNRLVSALNSPSSTVGGVLPNQLTMAVFNFTP
ncbi:unnamed protein product [Sphagnum balticum]